MIDKFNNGKMYSYSSKINEPQAQPDPYIIKYKDNYYIYSTNSDGVIVYSSNDLLNWHYGGYVLKQSGFKEFWAPSVIEIDNKFYMYYSNMKTDSDDVHTQNIKVAVSNSPNGCFEYVCDLLEPFTIDAHVVNTSSGLYIFYCVNDYNADRPGTLIVLDKMLSPFQVEGKPKTVVKPSLDEEIFCKDRFKKGEHWHTIEGAFYFEHEDYHYLMYSGSAFTQPTYFIGYSIAKGKVNDLREIEFNKYPNNNTYAPLLKQDNIIEGTGHNSVLIEDNKFYIVFHGRYKNSDIKDKDYRTFFIAPLKVDKGKIMLDL